MGKKVSRVDLNHSEDRSFVLQLELQTQVTSKPTSHINFMNALSFFPVHCELAILQR